MNHAHIILKPGREKSLIFRHPWIFSGAIQKVPQEVQDGDIVDIVDQKGCFLARGYYNSKSNIALRVLTFNQEEKIDQKFLKNRLKIAEQRRKAFLENQKTTAYRLVFAEGDHLPGLVVDRYGDYLVIQIHTLGMEKLKNIIVDALIDIFQPKAIYERSDIAVRKKDGLQTQPKGLIYGNFSGKLIEVEEYEVKFFIDLENGQKTGFFLDQRENRFALKNYAQGKKVLNLFSYSGGFSCYALKFGAEQVTSVDISDKAMELCRQNVELNDFEPHKHVGVTQDVFEYLDQTYARKEQFDVVIVDPPAFAKAQKKLNNAINAYIKLNEAALKVLAPGGILMTASCSSFVTLEMFRSALFQAQKRANQVVATDLILLEQKLQPFDHPLQLNFPEGEYLKFVVLRKN